MDRQINIRVNGSHLTKDGRKAGNQHEANANALRITFDESWDGYAKTVTFWNAVGENPVLRTLTADLLENIAESTRIYICPIPGEAMTEVGELEFVIEGFVDGVRARTCADRLQVDYSPRAADAAASVDPTPTQAEQLQGQIESMLGDMQEAVQAAEEAVEKAGNITQDAERAETAAQTAEDAATEAKAAQTAAEQASANTPKISANNTWLVWDADKGTYVDTGVSARGEAGPAGKDGAPGKDGSDGQPGSAGTDGKDGVSPKITVTPITGGHRVTIEDAGGTNVFDVMDGEKGPAGAGSGDMLADVYDKQGRRQDIFDYVDEKTKDIDVDVTADEVTFADGETFQAKYDSGELTGPAGKDGADGQPGAAGQDGPAGPAGADGITPHIGTNGNWWIGETDTGTPATGPKGEDGAAGQDGAAGPAGADGDDYVLTEADKAEIAGIVKDGLGDLDITVPANKVTAGTLAGEVKANPTAQATLGNAQVRNITISNVDLTAGTSALAAGEVYIVYE